MMEDQSIVRVDESSRDLPEVLLPSSTLKPKPKKIEFDWERAIRIVRKNWRLSLAFMLVVLSLSLLVAFKARDTYEPKARIEVDPPGSEMFTLKDLLNLSMEDQDYLETQIQILQSDELAIEVIRNLRLDLNQDIVGPKALRQYSQPGGQGAASRTQLTKLENRALRAFQQRLTVAQVRNSRLVEVSFLTHEARLSSQITNSLVNIFIDRNYRTRYEATMQASEWLSGQLSDLQDKVEKANRALVDYQRANGIVSSDERVTQTASQLNHELTQTQTDRIQLEAYLKMLQSGNVDSLPQVHDNVLLQNLIQRYVEARAQLAQGMAVYGKNNPNLKKLKSQVDELQAQINLERQRILSQLNTAYKADRAKEQLLAGALKEIEGLESETKEKMIRYNILRNEAQTNNELYNTLLGRLKEAGITAGLKSSNIRLVDAARVLDKPTGPPRVRNIFIGLFLGFLGGVALAFVRESLDNTVRTPDDLKDYVDLPSLAMFPWVPGPNGHRSRSYFASGIGKLLAIGSAAPDGLVGRKFILDRPRSAEAEAVRSLRTSLLFSRPGRPPRVIIVTSGSPEEGKSTVAVNLALVFAQHSKTCLVDCDLRRPVIARTFGVSPGRGLTHILTGGARTEDVCLKPPDVENLLVLPVGPIPPNPGELVASNQMKELIENLRRQFEFVIIDSPPLIPFADGRALAPLTDGVVLVARAGLSTRRAILRSLEILADHRVLPLGIVLNGVRIGSPDYDYYMYGYSTRYRYGYGYEGYGNREEQGDREDL